MVTTKKKILHGLGSGLFAPIILAFLMVVTAPFDPSGLTSFVAVFVAIAFLMYSIPLGLLLSFIILRKDTKMNISLIYLINTLVIWGYRYFSGGSSV